MNAIKDAIKSGKTVVGTAGAPNVDVSVLADSGYDFLLFDTQHSPWGIKELQPSILAMRGKQAAPMVRVSANQADQICFALDAGARGIVVPMVNTSAGERRRWCAPAATTQPATVATPAGAVSGANSRIIGTIWMP